MSLIDIIGLGVSSIIMVVLSKSRFHIRNGCCSYSYNEHNVDISKLNAEDKENDSDDYDDLPDDSFRTLPPPNPSKIHKIPLPLPTCVNLQTMKKCMFFNSR
jgi:hypothetical protein